MNELRPSQPQAGCQRQHPPPRPALINPPGHAFVSSSAIQHTVATPSIGTHVRATRSPRHRQLTSTQPSRLRNVVAVPLLAGRYTIATRSPRRCQPTAAPSSAKQRAVTLDLKLAQTDVFRNHVQVLKMPRFFFLGEHPISYS